VTALVTAIAVSLLVVIAFKLRQELQNLLLPALKVDQDTAAAGWPIIDHPTLWTNPEGRPCINLSIKNQTLGPVERLTINVKQFKNFRLDHVQHGSAITLPMRIEGAIDWPKASPSPSAHLVLALDKPLQTWRSAFIEINVRRPYPIAEEKLLQHKFQVPDKPGQ
jgi:hypothetical protein